MADEPIVSMFYQVEAVREAASAARRTLTDAEIVWSAGDWRVQQLKKRHEHLTAAFNTLRKLHDDAAVSKGTGA